MTELHDKALSETTLDDILRSAIASASSDPHVVWMRELKAREDAVKSLSEDGEERTADQLMTQYFEFHDLICTTPARTVAGAREQVRLVAETIRARGTLEPAKCEALESALAALDRFVGER